MDLIDQLYYRKTLDKSELRKFVENDGSRKLQ